MDTPGHADFGGEVERVLRMADGALVLVDAAEGPMPQTRFVLSKALECRLRPVVVVNKIDRPDARPLEVLDEILGLFLELGADDDLADFPFVYASSRGGYASHDPTVREGTMEPLLDLVLEKIPGPVVDPTAPLRMLVTTLDWSDYVGRIAIGRVESGMLTKGAAVVRSTAAGTLVPAKLVGVQSFDKLGRIDVEQATAGDIAAVSGIEDVEIGDTICDAADPRPLPRLTVDEPTLSMVFGINTLLVLVLARNGAANGSGLGTIVVFVAATGGGAVLATLFTPAAIRRWGRYASVNAALLSAAVIQLAGATLYVTVLEPLLMVGCGFLLGVSGQVIKLCADSAMQIDVDDTMRGHVFAVQDSLFWISFIASVSAAATVIPADGRSPMLAVVAALLYLAGFAAHARTGRLRTPTN
jgi:hypothetical protein